MKNTLINTPAKLAAVISKSLTNKLVQAIASSWLIALGAHIIIPFYPVHMTLQSFAIALISLLVPVEVAIGSVLFYVGYAAMGIPVLQGGGKGIAALLGPTAGYIIGFFFMSAIISLLMKHYPNSGILKKLLFSFLGGAVLFLLGIAYLAHLFNWDIAIKTGLLPFVFSEPVKYALAAYLSVFVQGKYLRK
jgi:biotin transport system substrate-specific component